MRYRIGKFESVGTTEHLCVEMELSPGNWSRMEMRDAFNRLLSHEAEVKILRESGIVLREAVESLLSENAHLRTSLLNKRGDDLCWIENHDAMLAAPLPKEEMLESCRRYVDQLHAERPPLCAGQMTIAQLEQRVVELQHKLEKGHDLLSRLRRTQCCDPVIDGLIGAVIERLE